MARTSPWPRVSMAPSRFSGPRGDPISVWVDALCIDQSNRTSGPTRYASWRVYTAEPNACRVAGPGGG